MRKVALGLSLANLGLQLGIIIAGPQLVAGPQAFEQTLLPGVHASVEAILKGVGQQFGRDVYTSVIFSAGTIRVAPQFLQVCLL
jgi:hypothetical protein